MFLVVSMAAVAVFAALIIVAARSEVSGLSARRRSDDLVATAASAEDAYARAGGWNGADLAQVAAVAARAQATVVVLDHDGNAIAAPTDELATMMARMHGVSSVDAPRGDPVSAPVLIDGRAVGAVMLRFPTGTLGPEQHVRARAFWAALSGLLLSARAP